MRPRLLDAYCAAGGTTKGYQRAGWHVTGVDLHPQPNYCGDIFIHANALEYLAGDLSSFDAIAASPPCQHYMRGGLATGDHPDLLPRTRDLLEASGLPWVIENVPGAPMRPDAVLCGSMFGLPIRRHRWFEFSWGEPLMTPACDHSRPVVGVYGHPHGSKGAAPGMLPGSLETWSEALGIDWMTTSELALAIPPAYTQLIGEALLAHVQVPA